MRSVARTQGGVITSAQCAGLGATASAIRRLLGADDWRRVRRGVYLDPTFCPRRVPDRDHHAACATLLAGLPSGAAAASHTSAARLLGLPLPPRADRDVVITRRPPAPADRLGDRSRVHVARFDDADLLDVMGVPVLAGPRLIVDCCVALAPDSALAVADAALRRGLVGAGSLEDYLRRHPRRRGAPVAARVVQRMDPLAEGWFESVSRWWLLEAGLPRPQLQVRFTDADGLVGARVDMYLPEHRTVGEADGAGKYDDPGALFAEKQREDWLRDEHRVEVVRWVPREMGGPAGRRAVVDRFHRAFARNARRTPSAPQQENGPYLPR